MSNLRDPIDSERAAATYRKTVAFSNAGAHRDGDFAERTTAAPIRAPIHVDHRENNIRLAQLAMEQARDARPAEKFEGGSTAQYVALMKRFDTAVDVDGMTPRRKLMEMSFWFKGFPCRIAESYQTQKDDDIAYSLARSSLDALFGQVDDTAVPALKAAASGPQIEAEDHKGHLSLFTALRKAQSLAEALDRNSELERHDLIMDVIHKRLGHMLHVLIQKELKAKRKNRAFGFQQLIDAVAEWTAVLQRSRPSSNPPTSPDDEAINETQRPETQSTAGCGVCEGSHSTERCPVLVRLHADDKVRKIKERRLCLHCFQPHHLARDCAEIPSCLVCHQRHHTILHGRSPPTPRHAPTVEQSPSFVPPLSPPPTPPPSSPPPPPPFPRAARSWRLRRRHRPCVTRYQRSSLLSLSPHSPGPPSELFPASRIRYIRDPRPKHARLSALFVSSPPSSPSSSYPPPSLSLSSSSSGSPFAPPLPPPPPLLPLRPIVVLRFGRKVPNRNRLHRRTSLEPSSDLGSRSLEQKTSNFGNGFFHPFRLDRARPEVEELLGPSTMGPAMEAALPLVRHHYLSKSSNPIVLTIIPYRFFDSRGYLFGFGIPYVPGERSSSGFCLVIYFHG